MKFSRLDSRGRSGQVRWEQLRVRAECLWRMPKPAWGTSPKLEKKESVARGGQGTAAAELLDHSGDLAAAALSNSYYPASNRRLGLFLGNFLIGTGQRAAANLAQEFILRRLTPKAEYQK